MVVLSAAEMTNDLVDDGLKRGAFRAIYPDYLGHRREVTNRSGRFDFCLDTRRGPLWLEVKAVSLLAEDRQTGLFPDATTERGARQLRHLATLTELGERTSVLFVAMRRDVIQLRANEVADPDFARTLEKVYKAGVHVAGWGSRLEGNEVRLTHELPVLF